MTRTMNEGTLNGTASPKVRDSSIELFRIITMFVIVAHHYVVNSGLTDTIIEKDLAERGLSK